MTHSSLSKNEIINALEGRGLKVRDRGRYAVSQCPTHEDRNASAQVFYDEGFVHCHAGCDRQHITKIMPELKKTPYKGVERSKPMDKQIKPKRQYRKYNEYDLWQKMERIPRTHEFKSVPLEALDDLGWRYVNGDYYIPYFNMGRNEIPFSQTRHLQGDRRFSFLKDAKPIAYGLWNLHEGSTLFVVEGTSDCATLEYCAIPWLGIPSASSGSLLKNICEYADKNDIKLVFAGDNDEAGRALKKSMTCSFRTHQPPKDHKDWSDFLDATDLETVQDYAKKIY